MLVWGGANTSGAVFFNDGASYDPATDTWTPIGMTNAPVARHDHRAVWTGTKMIVWGGYDGGYLNSGGIYDPVAETWTATSLINVPAVRSAFAAVWSGSEMIVFGGGNGSAHQNTGGRYNPATDTWAALPVSPQGRNAWHQTTAVWTGTEMLIWGGSATGGQKLSSGARYNPVADSWTAMSTVNTPAARDFHAVLWTGSEMLVWSGAPDNGTNPGGPPVASGGRYRPATDSWVATSMTNAPEARRYSNAVWTGTTAILWGGSNGEQYYGDTFAYAASPIRGEVIVNDVFDGDSLDGSAWNYSLPFVESTLSVGDGVLTLNNRAIISTIAQVEAPITVSGSLKASRYDIVRISTRTDLSVRDEYSGELNGLHFSFHFDSNRIQISDSNWNVIAQASYSFNAGEWYDFEITDDGSNLLWSINGIQQLTAVDNTSTGTYVSIYNREVNRGWAIPSAVQFDEIRITENASPWRIAVEDAVGTPIVPNGVQTFPSVAPASTTTLAFTIRNTDAATLNVSSVSVTGGNASDFVVNTTGMLDALPASAQTTFQVAFTPAVSGARTTTLRIVSDDPLRSPYDITLSGNGLSFTVDTDGDGLNDASEYQLSGLGFDWQVNQTAQVSSLPAVLNAAGFFTPAQVQALHMDTPLVQRNPATGTFTLTIGVQKSANLTQFNPFPMSQPQTSINGEGRLEFQFTVPDNTAFFRLQAQ